MSSQITSKCEAVQQFNPNTGFLDPQIYYPVYHDGFPYYYIEPYGWCPAHSHNQYQNEWTHAHYASSPLLPDNERPQSLRKYSPKHILDLYKKSNSHFQWKDKEQKHGNPIPNGAWGRFRLEADKIFRNCTVPRTKKLPRVRSHRELIDHMQRLYTNDARRPRITEKLPTHHGVVYDKWKSNKDRRDAADAERGEHAEYENEEYEYKNYENTKREKVVICNNDCDVTIYSENEVCEGGEANESKDKINNTAENDENAENAENTVKAEHMTNKSISQNKSKSEKTVIKKSPRKPFGLKN